MDPLGRTPSWHGTHKLILTTVDAYKNRLDEDCHAAVYKDGDEVEFNDSGVVVTVAKRGVFPFLGACSWRTELK